MTNKELNLLDEIDFIRRDIANSPIRCDDKNCTGLNKIKSLIAEHFSNNENLHSGAVAQKLLSHLFAKLEEFKIVPIDDYNIRVIEAIIADYFGYKSRAKWCDLLIQDKTSKYYSYCRTELPFI